MANSYFIKINFLGIKAVLSSVNMLILTSSCIEKDLNS